MLPNTVFTEKIPVPSEQLPLTLISLETWVLVRLTGIDSIQYLHNQLTCDIKSLHKNQYSFSAYCNPTGRMISNMYVFFLKNQEIAFIEPISVSEKQISNMQKYATFSKVTIKPDYKATLIGVSGQNARKYLNTCFNILPDPINTVVHHNDVVILHFKLPIERFLLIITNKLLLTDLLDKSHFFSVQYNNHYQWTTLDIEAGYPYIDIKTSELFVPQAVNMDILGGIGFNKGCYLGQELIARIQYRKLNKQSLCQLVSNDFNNNQCIQLPMPGDWLEIQINNQYWRDIGIVLQSSLIKQNNIWVQAVLNKSIIKDSLLRIKNIQYNNNLYFHIIT